MGNKKNKLERKEVKLAVKENLGALVGLRMEGTEEQVNELQEEITEVKEVMKAFAEDIGSLVAHCQQMNIAVAQFRKDQDTLIKANDSLSKRIKEVENG